MTRRSHTMPFGTRILGDGRVRFRLWAPGAKRVELLIYGSDGPMVHAMAAEENGWYERICAPESVGLDYRYRVDGELEVADPASRFQPEDAEGPSMVLDPARYAWHDDGWRGCPWEESVVYEIHVGTFTPSGTFAGVMEKLDYLADLGITAIELMPLNEFPGKRNWGYDGVLLFAADSAYGTPDDLKALVEAAHDRGLMVFLDVVYNHFGPKGNYLHRIAPEFFTDRHRTPWGSAINFEGHTGIEVREFFIHNALYWLEEYHFDGLRLDSVHDVIDESAPHFLEELARRVREGPGRCRHIHLVLENDANTAHYLQRSPNGSAIYYQAQWNDDWHHVMHILLTGETDGYYQDYSERPVEHLMRCLTEGFAYQGEPSPYRGGRKRGEPSGGLPATAFVNFLQNHDQVGNRALGERLTTLAEPDALRTATALLLLAPSPPLLFMGQEWASERPFTFFVDFDPELGESVARGRRREFQKFARFRGLEAETIPHPNEPSTFRTAILDWEAVDAPEHRRWLDFHRKLLDIRRRRIIPKLRGMTAGGTAERLAERALQVMWRLPDGSVLTLLANLGDAPAPLAALPEGEILFATCGQQEPRPAGTGLAPRSVVWLLREAAEAAAADPELTA